eukprot:2531023-Rhodomonas_salina.1
MSRYTIRRDRKPKPEDHIPVPNQKTRSRKTRNVSEPCGVEDYECCGGYPRTNIVLAETHGTKAEIFYNAQRFHFTHSHPDLPVLCNILRGTPELVSWRTLH